MVGTRKFDESCVLEHALNVFWSKGYNATTTLDLANETGVQRGSLYNAYKNKNTLFVKAFEHYINSFLKHTSHGLQESNAKVAFFSLFEQLVERLSGDAENKGCFSTRTMMEAADECPEITRLLKAFLDGLEEIFAERLTLAVEEKQFTGDPRANARYLVSITRGIAVIERIYDDKQRLTDIYTIALGNMAIA